MHGNRILRRASLFFLLLMLTVPSADGQEYISESELYGLSSAVSGSAGGVMTGSSYDLIGTLGQPHPVGQMTGTAYDLFAGFWYRFYPVTTGAEETPLVFRLSQNYPNPFNPATSIDYSITGKAIVELAVYDVSGRRVRTLVSERQLPGFYTAVWDGRNDGGRPVASGVYFYRLSAGRDSGVKKMIVLR